MTRPMRCRRLIPAGAFLLLLAILPALPAGAQTPSQREAESFETTRQIVFGLAPFDGGRYLATFAPEQRETIYLPADFQHVITVNMSDIYYWPITAEWRADFQGFNIQLPGTLRVLRSGRVIDELEQRRFIYIFPHGPQGEATHLLFGREMDDFIEERSRAVEAYRDGKAERIPAATYQGPFQGFILRLGEGRYRLEYEIERDDRQFSLSKELVVFSHLDRGIHYEIIPQDKWTVSSASDSPHKAIYLKSGQVIYLKSYPSYLYNHARYDLMASPQRPMAGLGLENSALWVSAERSLEERDGASVEMAAAGERVVIHPRDYLVRQRAGSALGYEIVEYSREEFPDRRPSFRAYRITSPPVGVKIHLSSPAEGETSSRTIRTLDPGGLPYTAIAVAFPLFLLFLRIILARRGRRIPAEVCARE